MSPSVVLLPGAPVLVPELAGSAWDESAGAVDRSLGILRTAARGVSEVVVWGCDAAGRGLGDVRTSLRRWGAEVPVGREDAPDATCAHAPDAALIAWWFLDRAGVEQPRSFVAVGDGAPERRGPGAGTLVVVVADGPASLTPRAPVPEDPRGVALDSRITAWLTGGGALPDPGATEADEVGWWSRPAWRALEALTGGRPAAESASWAPFGVGYHCARWEPAASATGDAEGLA